MMHTYALYVGPRECGGTRLDLATVVADGQEGELAHDAPRHDAPRHAHRPLHLLARRQPRVLLLQLSCKVRAVEAVAVRLLTAGAQLLGLRRVMTRQEGCVVNMLLITALKKAL